MKKKIIYFLVSLFHKCFDHDFFVWLKGKKNYLYTLWIQQEFGSCGEECFFGQFLQLIGAKYATIGNHVTMGSNVVLEIRDAYMDKKFTPTFKMGDYSHLGDWGHISCINGVIIGNNVRMGRKVFITDNAHGASDIKLLDMRPNLRPLYSKGPVIIEDNVWVGEQVCIMPGVTISHGSIIGANAVVTHDVPPYCVVGGNPARVIKDLRQ